MFVLSRASDNTTSLNIGGTNAWAVPHLKFLWGTVPPVPPRPPPLPLPLESGHGKYLACRSTIACVRKALVNAHADHDDNRPFRPLTFSGITVRASVHKIMYAQ